MAAIRRGVQDQPERATKLTRPSVERSGNRGCSVPARGRSTSQPFALSFPYLGAPTSSRVPWNVVALTPLDFLVSKAWDLAQLLFLYQATEVSRQPLDWLPLGSALILVQAAVVRRGGYVVPVPTSVTWEWVHSGTV